jgi:hypothetical protein
MDEIEITPQAKQAAMLAVMAAGDASNEKAWRSRVQAGLPRFAALVRDDYGYWGREAQGILDAAVFTATYQGHELEESSTRLIVKFTSETTAKSDADDDGSESLRTERTDTPPGWHMKRKIEALEQGQPVVVWKKVEAIDATRKVRVLVHLEPLRSKSGGEERASNRPSARPEGGAPSPSSPSGGGALAPDGQVSAEAAVVQQAMVDLSAAKVLAIKRRCVSEDIENWTDPGPENIDRVLTIIKEVTS